MCVHPNHPVDKTLGQHFTKLTSWIWIEKSDFREIDSADYYRLVPGKTIRLKYTDFVQYVKHEEMKDTETPNKEN